MPKTRFFTWYRVAPLAVMFVFGLISLVYSYAPAAFFKPLYPIDYEAYESNRAFRTILIRIWCALS